MFSLTAIGVNGAFSHSGFNTNFLLENSQTSFLVDCGSTAGAALASLDKELSDIENIYISHLHLDHTGGLDENGFKRKFLGLAKTNIYLHESLLPIIWDGLLKTVMGSTDSWQKNEYFNFIPISGSFQQGGGEFKLGSFSVRTVEVKHTENISCHGLIIEEKVFLTTDARYQSDLLKKVSNAFDLKAIIHDCSISSDLEEVHASHRQLSKESEQIKKLLLLSHYEDNFEELFSKIKEKRLPLIEQGKPYHFD